MPNIIDTSQQKEWKFARALKKYLPNDLEWSSDSIGYPFLYEKGWRIFKGCVASLTGNIRVTIKRPKWKDAILEALVKYEAANGVTIDVQLGY